MVVKYNDIHRAMVTVSNLSDEARVMDVTANAWISSDNFESLESGQVKENDSYLASFYYYGENNLSVNFTCSPDRQDEVLNVVNEFVDACKALGGVNSL